MLLSLFLQSRAAIMPQSARCASASHRLALHGDMPCMIGMQVGVRPSTCEGRHDRLASCTGHMLRWCAPARALHTHDTNLEACRRCWRGAGAGPARLVPVHGRRVDLAGHARRPRRGLCIMLRPRGLQRRLHLRRSLGLRLGCIGLCQARCLPVTIPGWQTALQCLTASRPRANLHVTRERHSLWPAT